MIQQIENWLQAPLSKKLFDTNYGPVYLGRPHISGILITKYQKYESNATYVQSTFNPNYKILMIDFTLNSLNSVTSWFTIIIEK